jgi:hypothetical protein
VKKQTNNQTKGKTRFPPVAGGKQVVQIPSPGISTLICAMKSEFSGCLLNTICTVCVGAILVDKNEGSFT